MFLNISWISKTVSSKSIRKNYELYKKRKEWHDPHLKKITTFFANFCWVSEVSGAKRVHITHSLKTAAAWILSWEKAGFDTEENEPYEVWDMWGSTAQDVQNSKLLPVRSRDHTTSHLHCAGNLWKSTWAVELLSAWEKPARRRDGGGKEKNALPTTFESIEIENFKVHISEPNSRWIRWMRFIRTIVGW